MKDKTLTDQQRERITTIVLECAPSLPDAERIPLVEQIEAFTEQVSDAAYIVGQNEGREGIWIPVTSHRPEPGERVLIFVPRWGVLTIGWRSKADPTRWELITMPGKNTDQVSHWQPLPTGPLTPPAKPEVIS